MAISTIGPVEYNQQVSDPTSTGGELGRSDFLTMFITQLQHQDPLNPVENTEFTAQLAQFSSLEQLFNINEASQQLITSNDSLIRMQSLSLIGEEIQAEGNALVLQDDSTASGSFTLAEAVTQCMVSIYDDGGRLVGTLDLGALNEGNNHFTWDGVGSNGQDLQAGIYTFQVSGKNPDSNDVGVKTRTSGVVTGVRVAGSTPLLLIDEIEVPLFSIIEVKPFSGPPHW